MYIYIFLFMSGTLTATHIDVKSTIFTEIEEKKILPNKRGKTFRYKINEFFQYKAGKKKTIFYLIYLIWFFMKVIKLVHLEHNLWELFLILLSVLVEDNLAELRKEDQAVPGDGVGHVGDLLLHHVQAEADQGGQEILHINAGPSEADFVLLECGHDHLGTEAINNRVREQYNYTILCTSISPAVSLSSCLLMTEVSVTVWACCYRG